MFKRLALTAAVTALVATGGIIGWTHCHDNVDCEDLAFDLVSGNKWKKSMPIRYWISRDFSDSMPALYNDVVAASNAWTSIWFDGDNVDFRLSYQGACDESPDEEDQKNVVGWGVLPANKAGKARLWIIHSQQKIVEADMILNYYLNWDYHNQTDNTEYCIRNTATHEFGHFLGLLDVYNTCTEYSRYTMYGYTPGTNEHKNQWC